MEQDNFWTKINVPGEMRESFTSVFAADRGSQSKQDPYTGTVPTDPVPSPFCLPAPWGNGRKSRC